MSADNKYKPILAITMGDPAGIGPEIAAKTLAMKSTYKICRPVLIGHMASMKKICKDLKIKLKLNTIQQISEAKCKPGIIDIIEVNKDIQKPVEKGIVSAEAGDIAFNTVKKAIDLALATEVDGTVTGPIHKEAINKAGHQFAGHTEIYAHFTNTKKYAMLLVDEEIKVIHATTHVSLREACDLIKKDRVLDVIQLMHDGLERLGFSNPQIGVAGLNPHSGDGGLFGKEDIDEIKPAVEAAQKMGLKAVGPVPADTLFALAKGGKYDGCVAMYHDQGHIPFKLMGFDWDRKKKKMQSVKGVNITLGLPIIRTSVDHGTAFEIAGKGIASPDALVQAIKYAVKLVK